MKKLSESVCVDQHYHLKRMYPLGRKYCTSKYHQGSRWLLWHEFQVGRRDEFDRPRELRPACRTCTRVQDRITKGLKLYGKPMKPIHERYINGQRPLTTYERQKRYLKKPENRARRNETRRLRHEERRVERGLPPRKPVPQDPSFMKVRGSAEKLVDIAPLVKWIERKLEEYGSFPQLAHACEVHEDSLRRWQRGYEIYKGKRSPIRRISIDTVDWILTREGTTNLWELYDQD